MMLWSPPKMMVEKHIELSAFSPSNPEPSGYDIRYCINNREYSWPLGRIDYDNGSEKGIAEAHKALATIKAFAKSSTTHGRRRAS